MPSHDDFLLFGAWDGTALAVLTLVCGAVSRSIAQLDRIRGTAFARSERICRTLGAMFSGMGALGFLASWSALPQHRPGIWAATFVLLTGLLIVGWYGTVRQVSQGRRRPERGSEP